MLPKRNRMQDNFYTIKSMMKPLGLGYQKINMYPNFWVLYHGEYATFIECKTCQHAQYKPNNGRGRTLIIYKKNKILLNHS